MFVNGEILEVWRHFGNWGVDKDLRLKEARTKTETVGLEGKNDDKQHCISRINID